MIQKTLRFAVACTLLATNIAAMAESSDEVMTNLKRLYPNTTFKSVKTTPVDGIFEVVMGKNVAYVESTGRYFFFGRLYDMPDQRDLTESVLNSAKRVDLSELPLKNAIKTVKGNGAKKLYVFSDPDCPFCKQLEQSLALVNNVTIYTFLLPLDQLHPDATRKAKAVWCSKDRSAAWKATMLDGKAPQDAPAACDAPIADNIALAQKIHALATPILINEQGLINAGALPLAKLEAFINPTNEVASK